VRLFSFTYYTISEMRMENFEIEKDYIITIHPDNKNGIRIRVDHYNAVKDFLLSVLAESPGMSFNTLLLEIHEHFYNEFRGNTGWFIYNIKLDLEARGLITHNRSAKIITINKKMHKVSSTSDLVKLGEKKSQ
jgi:hypothetical protein